MTNTMTNEEYDIRAEFADNYIVGWKGDRWVGRAVQCSMSYTRGNARLVAYHMTDGEFNLAKASIKFVSDFCGVRKGSYEEELMRRQIAPRSHWSMMNRILNFFPCLKNRLGKDKCGETL